MEETAKGEGKEEARRESDRRKMLLWILAVMLVIVAYSAIEIHEQWKMYDAGRLRERKEIASRLGVMIESGKRGYCEDLGIYVIPDGPKHIKASRQRIAKGER